MSYDTQYRPHLFRDIVGQRATIKILRQLLRKGQVFQKSYVFAGPSGTGKTTTARILARAMLCEDIQDPDEGLEPCNECHSCSQILEKGSSPSFVEMDAANNSGKDNIQKIVESLDYYTIGGSDRKIYLIDECHRLSKQAMDALLKPMEDTVPGSKDKRLVCLFCTTEPQKLRGTIKGRCMVFQINEPPRDEVVARLRYICENEDIEFDDEALSMIFDYGKGHLRDMVNALERVSRVDVVSTDSVRAQLGLDVVTKAYEILLNLKSTPAESMDLLAEALTQTDPSSVYEGIADAAVASYRVSKGITIGLGYVEKELAGQIYDRYGDDVLEVAHHIYEYQGRIDRNALICELLVLHQRLKNGTLVGGQVVVHEVPQKSIEVDCSKQVEDSHSEKAEESQEVLSESELERMNTDMAEEAMSYGARSAKGKPEVPKAEQDPLEKFDSDIKPVKNTTHNQRPPVQSDYDNITDRMK